ncbi:MAG: hypothetical protein CO143_02715 [Candidatus Moranbacteria bacterium CG_4_9_14_3_um_filter_45_14]|nr:MAG: hypothetical protein CO143_02715 [Candidatus Moranbacteria bacterium CG_4_9_14_3_um_filter_45_14]
MSWSLIIGLLIVIAFVLIRLGQSGRKLSTLWARFQKPSGMVTSTTTATAKTSQKSNWGKPLIWIAGIVIGIVAISIFFGKTSFLKKTSVDAYGWNLIETIICPMGKETWEKGRGWCTSQVKLEPGTYRLLLKEVRWDVAFWDPTTQSVVEYRAVPSQGISLSEWQNNPSYVRTFLKDAPVGGNRRFGSIIAKIGEQQAFDPFQKGSFEIEKATILSIGPNIPFCDVAFIHNRGMIVVEIEKEM